MKIEEAIRLNAYEESNFWELWLDIKKNYSLVEVQRHLLSAIKEGKVELYESTWPMRDDHPRDWPVLNYEQSKIVIEDHSEWEKDVADKKGRLYYLSKI